MQQTNYYSWLCFTKEVGGGISFVSGERESIIVFYFFSLLLSVLRSIICNETRDFERDIFFDTHGEYS